MAIDRDETCLPSCGQRTSELDDDVGVPAHVGGVVEDGVAEQCDMGHGEILFGNSDLAALDIANPDDYRNRADSDFIDLTVDKVGTRFPGFTDPAITTSYAGCYDVTPDWNPIISSGPLDGLVLAAGFSGHGFKISPAVGRLIADLVVDGRSADPRVPESDFRFTRFAEGDLLTTRFPYVGAGEMR